MGAPQQSTYAASKAGTEALACVWATELGQSRGITVNCVNPGPVSTEVFRASAPEFIEALEPVIESTSAEARIGETSDIAPLVRYVEPNAWWCFESINANRIGAFWPLNSLGGLPGVS